LVNTVFIGNQVSCHELPAGSLEFVRKTNIQQLPQTSIGVKADAVLIGNRYQYQVEQLLQAREAFVESLAQKR